MTKLYRVLQKTVDVFLILLLAATVISISIQVFFRFVFFYSASWTEELARYCFVYMVLIGACVGVRNDKQIVIDVIDSFVKGRAPRWVLALFQYTVQIIVVCILFYSSYLFLKIGARQRSTALPIMMSTAYMCFPIGYALVLLELLIKMCGLFNFKQKFGTDSGGR